MSTLQLSLLGRPQVSCDNVALTGWVFRKSLALLAYLAVTHHPHDRSTLAGLFWPENTEAAAHANLRKVVSELHDRIPAHLTITRADIAFNLASSYSLDVETFLRVFAHAYPARGSALTCTGAEALVEAIDLYRDDFLLGLALRPRRPLRNGLCQSGSTCAAVRSRGFARSRTTTRLKLRLS